MFDAHENHEGVYPCIPLPLAGRAFEAMPCNHGETLRHSPIRERNAGQPWNRDRRTDARNQLHLNPALERKRPLFRAAPENERVAAFQACDDLALASTLL